MTRKAAFVLLLCALLAGCRVAATTTTATPAATPAPSTTTTVPEPTLRVALVERPAATNWWAALGEGASWTDRVVARAHTASLFAGSSLDPVPDLAAPPLRVPRRDGDTWVVEQGIVAGRTWSDGTPIAAADLVFYLETARRLALDGEHVVAAGVEVEAVDDHTLRFRFETEPWPGLWPGAVGFAPFAPAHHWEDSVREVADRFDLYSLEAPEPPRAAPGTIDWVVAGSREDAYRALERGEVDLVADPDGVSGLPGNVVEGLEASPLVATTVSPRSSVRALAMNQRHAPFDDPAFRFAIAAVIDRRELAAELGALPAYSWLRPDETVPSGPGTFDGDWLDLGARVEASVAALTEAGFRWEVPPGGGTAGWGLRFPGGSPVGPMEMLVPAGDPLRVRAGEWIAGRLALLGIEVTVVAEPDLPARILPPIDAASAGSWALALVGWRDTGPSDPAARMIHLFHSSEDAALWGGTNVTGFASDGFDDLADRYRVTPDPVAVAEAAAAMEALLLREVPQLLLYRETVIEVHSSALPFAPVAGGIASDPRTWPRQMP